MDIIFADPGDPKIGLVNETNCFNSTDMGFADMFTTATKYSGSAAYVSNSGSLFSPSVMGYFYILLAGLFLL